MLAIVAAAWLAWHPLDPVALAAWDRSRLVGHPVSRATATAIGKAVRLATIRTGIPPAVLLALIEVESSYDIRATSKAGCVGLCQLSPRTAAEFRFKAGLTRFKLTDPEDSIALGAAYLRWNLDRHGTLGQALTCYNLGSARHRGGVSDYARKIIRLAKTIEIRYSL